MAKTKQVVVSQTYLDVLIRKAEMLDAVFGGGGEASITRDDFKDFVRLQKAFEKTDQTVSHYP